MYQIHRQDILEWAREYDGPPFHATLLDPPYHLTSITKRFGKSNMDNKDTPNRAPQYKRLSKGFMGQQWDGGGIAFDPATWAALAQHLYPGAFIMAFGGSRGYHRMACAMEDAGLIIHPAMGWLTLSGFPKATRIDRAIDRAAGVKVEQRQGFNFKGRSDPKFSDWEEKNRSREPLPPPATPLARDWAGHRYGLQALKPAFEFIAVAQVPYEGRPVENIVATGAGALNIDGGRIGLNGDKIPTGSGRGFRTDKFVGSIGRGELTQGPTEGSQNGRWPSNFLLQCGCDPNRLDPAHQEKCPVRLFDEQAGETSSNSGTPFKRSGKEGGKNGYDGGWKAIESEGFYGDSGPASRMFHQSNWAYEVAEQLANVEPVRYEPKVSSSERDAGLDDLETITRHRMRPDADPEKLTGLNTEPRFAPTQVKNNHPCLKPISLTKYLATLLLPPMAYAPRRILIPFAGSGSECIGAMLAGFEEIVGIEQSEQYCSIARARLAWWSQWPGWGQTDVDAILAAAGKDKPGQLSLFSEAA